LARRSADRCECRGTTKIAARERSTVWFISHLGSGTRGFVTNVSAEGAAIEAPDASHIPIDFETDRVVQNCQVVWIKRNKLGVQFEADSQFTESHLSSRQGLAVLRTEMPTHPQRQLMST